MKISVITSVFNSGKYLVASIKSVVEQTYPDFEFIIIDDGSSDDSSDILDDFSRNDPRIKVLRNNNNIGLTKSLNIALKQTSGYLIARHDADDISEPDRFEKQVKFLNNHPEIFLVGSGVTLIDHQGKIKKRSNTIVGSERVKKTLEQRNCINHPTIMFRSSPPHLYREKFVYAQDYDFYLTLLSDGLKLDNLSNHLVRRTIVGSSIGESKTIKQALFAKKALDLYRERINERNDSYDDFDPVEIMGLDDNAISRVALNIKIINAVNKRSHHESRSLIASYIKMYGLDLNKILLFVQSYLPNGIRDMLLSIKNVIYE